MTSAIPPVPLATSPLPPFDGNGNLPCAPSASAVGEYSVLHCSIADMKTRFVDQVAGSTTRAAIWDGWMRHREDMAKLGLQFSTLVDGSFITSKTNPGDIDLCYLFAAAQLNGMDPKHRPALKALLETDNCKKQYRCDPYHAAMHDVTHYRFAESIAQLAYWYSVFGVDRKGKSKSFLIITEGVSP